MNKILAGSSILCQAPLKTRRQNKCMINQIPGKEAAHFPIISSPRRTEYQQNNLSASHPSI
ncbi:hypothetical protein H6A26_11590 [Enterococcus gallinarum]|nr:hypothetical protein [Enterococcus gallinarum]